MIEVLIGIGIAVIAVLFILMLWDSNRFITVNYQFQNKHIRKKVRFVLLADLHNKEYGKKNEKLLQAIQQAQPDAVLVAGDLITSGADETEAAGSLLEALSKHYPIYYANGNHENRIFHQTQKYGNAGVAYRRILKKYGICLLEDANVFLPQYSVRIYGLDLPSTYYKKFSEPGLDRRELKKRLGKADPDAFTILLAHNPVWFEDYAEWGADLTLSGHVHGGVVRLPFVGGVISTSFRLFPKYDGGAFEEDGKHMVISRGLGAHTIPVRLFNPAELVVIDLIPDTEEK